MHSSVVAMKRVLFSENREDAIRAGLLREAQPKNIAAFCIEVCYSLQYTQLVGFV